MKPALLVIDLINDIAHPKGKIARSAERIEQNQVLSKVNSVIRHARKKNWPIVFVKVGFHAHYPECPKQSPLFGPAESHGALALGTWGTEFVEGLDVQPSDLVMVKHRVNCFYGTPLETILRARGIDTVILTGTATNMTVEHTGRDAHDRDYAVVVVEDACETATEEAQKASLANLSRLARIVDAKTLAEEF